jgi:hypothetical protein
MIPIYVFMMSGWRGLATRCGRSAISWAAAFLSARPRAAPR